MMDKMVFLDLETTGLHPKADTILELGVLVVDVQTMRIETAASWPIYHERMVRDDCSVRVPTSLLINVPFVRDMHTRNGLLAVCDGHTSMKMHEVEDAAMEIIPLRSVLAGFSVHFDRSFIDEHMPRLGATLHHRIVNVSSFRDCMREWLRDRVPGEADFVAEHRALADCMDAYRELCAYRSIVLEWDELKHNPIPHITLP